jgi:hypothetical protein
MSKGKKKTIIVLEADSKESEKMSAIIEYTTYVLTK